MLATVRHSVSNKSQDAMNVWVEELKADYFRVCLREVKTFDGKHQNLKVASLTRIVLVHMLKYFGFVNCMVFPRQILK